MAVKMHIRGDKLWATVHSDLLRSGWYGGQWIRYIGVRTIKLATKTEYAGFIMLGHKLEDVDGTPYNYSDNVTGNNWIPYQYENKAVTAPRNRALIIAGGGDYDFNKNVYDTTKTYVYNEKLYVNDNAIITNVDVGAPPVGLVNSAPQDNNNWLGITLKY